jgi:RES domain-containing protein
MILYRLAKENYVDDLSGTGARLYGGRWNSKGMAAVYLASSKALALLEVLVHLPPLIEPKNYFCAEIEVPENSVTEISIAGLPYNWADMQSPPALKSIGDDFLQENKYLLLKVPSAIVQAEYNYLLNVQHPDMKNVRVVKKELFNFDKRLYKN